MAEHSNSNKDPYNKKRIKDENASSRAITAVKHHELNQYSVGWNHKKLMTQLKSYLGWLTSPLLLQQLLGGGGGGGPPDVKRYKLEPPPQSERVMIYVRQDSEEAFTPLHLVSHHIWVKQSSKKALHGALFSRHTIDALNGFASSNRRAKTYFGKKKTIL